ncbi:unnamed protein product [Symbiodinium sp. CCMP2456]|nr:unnamed protein product [Symbiodinium sp. CCMP2456]
MIPGEAAAAQHLHQLQQHYFGPPNEFSYVTDQGGYDVRYGYWPQRTPVPRGNQSWGMSGWYGGQYPPPFSSYPVFEGDPEPQAAPEQAASSSTAATRSAAPPTSSPGRLGSLLPDLPEGDEADDPWREAARRPPELPHPTMRSRMAPTETAGFPGGLQQPPGLTMPWGPVPGAAWNSFGPNLAPPMWNGPAAPWSQTAHGGPDGNGPPGVWKGEFSDPPAWPGWQYRRQWVTAVRRWNKASDIPVGRRAERVLRVLGWEMATEFEHLSESQLAAHDYLERIVGVIEMKAGAREDDDRRACFKAVLHDNGRRRDESLGQFANRRLRDFTRASSYGIQLPNEFKAALLREGAGLSEQGLQNLTALTQGQDHDIDKLAHTLARMDVRSDRISGFVQSGERGTESSLMAGDFFEDQDDENEPNDEDDGSSLEDEEVLCELSDMNFTEEQAALVFAIMENRPPRPRRTWKENKKFKQDIRKDRRGFVKGDNEVRGAAPRAASRPTNRGGISREQLKKISRCNNCGRRGHWAEDCRQGGGNPRPTATDGGDKMSGFCYLGGSLKGASSGHGSHFTFMTYVTSQKDNLFPEASFNFLAIPSGMAILDIGATQDLIGRSAYESLERELSRHGLRALEVPTTASSPTGIGGAARVLKTALVPISPGGAPGVIQFLVIDGEVPPLLSVGFLEHLGCTLDLTTNQVKFKNIDVNMCMTSLPSGHRAIPLVQWKGGSFPVPPAAREQFGLGEDAFAKECAASSAYMKQGFEGLCHVHVGSTSVFEVTEHAQLSSWATVLRDVDPNSNPQPLATMDHPSRAMEPAAGERCDRVTRMWRAIVLRMFYTLESIRAGYSRLAAAETHQKSILSERKKFLTADAQVIVPAPPSPAEGESQGERPPEETIPAELGATDANNDAAVRDPPNFDNMSLEQISELAERNADIAMEAADDEYWPRWMTVPVISLSSTLVSWTQLQEGWQTKMLACGGDQECWMIHHSLPTAPGVPRRANSECPSWLRTPWTMEISGRLPDEYEVKWHELRRGREVLQRGAGDLPDEADAELNDETEVIRWGVPRRMGTVLAALDVSLNPRGFDEEGHESTTGPYWLVRAPGLRDIIEDQDEVAAASRKEDKMAESSLLSMTRQQRRESLASAVDYVEDKSHRQRFRKYLKSQRPITVALNLLSGFKTGATETTSTTLRSKTSTSEASAATGAGSVVSDGSTETASTTRSKTSTSEGSSMDNARSQLAVGFALEIVQEQVSHHRVFYMQAASDSYLWTCSKWNDLMLGSDIVIVTDFHSGIREATNSQWSQPLPPRPLEAERSSASWFLGDEWENMSEGEKFAYHLRQRGDFSFPSCLKLLRLTDWPRQRVRRGSIRDPSDYQVLGQYTYGKFAGMTLGTYKLRHTTQYLNDFMTRHGADGPRSSISVTRNATVRPHRDLHNLGDNYTIAIGPFKGGELWLADEAGQVPKEVRPGVRLPGNVLKHRERMNVFDPKRYHSVNDWEGERWSITAFQTRSSAQLSIDQAKYLESYGFSLQGYRGSPLRPQGQVDALCCLATMEAVGVAKLTSYPASTSADAIAQEPEEQSREPEDEVKEPAKDGEQSSHQYRTPAEGPDHHRRAQCPRVHGFNRVLSIDVFYIPFRGESVPILNVVDHGTNFQMAQRIVGSGARTPSAAATWKAFCTTWVRFMGPPSLIITDGGKEFQQRFERGIEQMGTLHHITAPESPWQNSRAERHGGWLKQRLTQELDSGRGIAENLDDVDELISAVVSAKNRWYNAGGYTPVQLVFGEMPRIPGDLLSQDNLGQLTRKVISGNNAGAVDVAREGPPAEARAHRLQDYLNHFKLPKKFRQSQKASFLETTRRSSVQEPAQEPEVAVAGEIESGGNQAVPNDANAQEPEAKHRRTTSREASPSGRAPGTPIQRLLQAVDRGRPARSTSQSVTDTNATRHSRSRSPERGASSREGDLNLWTLEQDGDWTLVASRSDEVDIRKMSKEERDLFDASDKVEWKAILDTKAVRVATGAEAEKIRREYPDRILDSRMVRRRKPQPGVGKWKAKSRWCIAGHKDPDTASLQTFSPTPATESILAFLQTGINLGHRFSFSDVRNAFCQSNKLRRPAGPIFARPCEGLGLGSLDVIVIEVPVYGLDDAPAAWRATVTGFLREQGFQRNVIEPCWWMRFNEDGKNEAQVLIEVDDFIISAMDKIKAKIRKMFEQRFTFGKWEDDEAEYAGRQIRVLGDRILVDQQKYITEQIQPVMLNKGRRSEKESPLTDEEFAAFRSAIYKVNWVAKESRPEVAGMASILASKLKNATIEDVLTLNKNVNYLRNTASRPMTIWKMSPREMSFVVISDAGGIGAKHDTVDEIGLPADSTQGAWLVFAAETLPVGDAKVKATPLSWRSSKLKRKVFSTFGGETQAMLQGIAEADWLQVMIRDAVYHDIELNEWRNCLSPHMLVMKGDYKAPHRQPQCSVADAKSLYDCVLKEHPQGRQDRRSSLELAIIVRDLQETRSMVRWVPHQKMVADALTKSDPMKANGALDQFLRSGRLSLVDVECELKHRAEDPNFRSRSHAASVARLSREYEEQGFSFWSTLIWGDCDNQAIGVVKLY